VNAVAVPPLPKEPLAAAGAFYDWWRSLDAHLLAADDHMTLIFAPADHTHRAWRRAAVAEWARAAAPARVNAVAGDDPAALARVAQWLAAAPGVTGQLFDCDGVGAGEAVLLRG